MRIKRYLAKTNKEALEKVKKELGNDAIILNTRKIKTGGFLGFFSKPWVEILAAVDQSAAANPAKNARLDEIEKKLYQIDNRISQYDKPTIQHNKDEIYKKLISNEVEKHIAESLIAQAESMSGDREESIKKVINSYLKYQSGFLPADKNICLFLGPTGVGKTTTLAKLAAIYSIKYKKSVGLITADTYRIAAVQQLKTYADIMGLPLEVVYSPQEMEKAVKKYNGKEIIMIDTAGKNMNKQENIMEINNLIAASGANEIFLVLSCVTRFSSIKNLLQSYNFIDDYKVIFTKLDETEKHGIIFNTCYISSHPLRYIATGQNVPDDIELFNPEKLIDSLLR